MSVAIRLVPNSPAPGVLAPWPSCPDCGGSEGVEIVRRSFSPDALATFCRALREALIDLADAWAACEDARQSTRLVRERGGSAEDLETCLAKQRCAYAAYLLAHAIFLAVHPAERSAA